MLSGSVFNLSKSLYSSLITRQFVRSFATRNVMKLSDRGIWSDMFPPSESWFQQSLVSEPQTVYSGFDPTGHTLHIGNLLVLNALIHFQRSGHHVIALIGGATGKIGDPSGKNKERPLLDKTTIKFNCDAISLQVERIFENHEKFIWKKINSEKVLHPIKIVNNLEWFQDFKLIDFFRKAGKHMSMNQLVKRISIKSRLDANQHLSFTEFAYQVLQAWDWYILYMKYGCSIQIGGHDQMGNIISGHDLINAKADDPKVIGLTVPLLKSETGDKLGKTSGTPVWLCPKETSPFDFYQSFVRIKDSEVENYLKLLTFIPLAEIDAVMILHQQKPHERLPQKKLAKHLTLLVHGEEGLEEANRCTQILYGGNHAILAEMTKDNIKNVFKGSLTSSQILEPGMSILDVVTTAKCFFSEEKAIEVIENGGLYINQHRVDNPRLVLVPGVHILPNNITLLRIGKKNYHIIDWKNSVN